MRTINYPDIGLVGLLTGLVLLYQHMVAADVKPFSHHYSQLKVEGLIHNYCPSDPTQTEEIPMKPVLENVQALVLSLLPDEKLNEFKFYVSGVAIGQEMNRQFSFRVSLPDSIKQRPVSREEMIDLIDEAISCKYPTE